MRINVKNLDQFLKDRDRPGRKPLELLILSACQTAVGDKRAALGLAGVAVRSGARSTLATLWSVQDQSTADLMTRFYGALNKTGGSKAESLRQAQLALLKSSEYNNPYYWAPFVLVGNWL
jgi:CHAT domain-containing protein